MVFRVFGGVLAGVAGGVYAKSRCNLLGYNNQTTNNQRLILCVLKSVATQTITIIESLREVL